MRVLIQRVKQASVFVDDSLISEIQRGLLLFLGIHIDDTEEAAEWLVDKCLALRIFSDQQDKMNLSLCDIDGSLLIVSQFTLYGTCTSGRRPEFTKALGGKKAKQLYEYFVKLCEKRISCTKTGVFGAKMDISLINDGPATFILEKF